MVYLELIQGFLGIYSGFIQGLLVIYSWCIGNFVGVWLGSSEIIGAIIFSSWKDSASHGLFSSGVVMVELEGGEC